MLLAGLEAIGKFPNVSAWWDDPIVAPMSAEGSSNVVVEKSQSGLMEMAKIALPTVATMTSFTLMTFTDKWLVSRIGPDPIFVGAQGNGGLASWVAISIAHGTLMVINTYVAQNLGAGKSREGPAYAWNGIWIGLAYWLVVLVPYGFLLPTIFRLAKMDPVQAKMASEYGSILVFGAGLTLTTRAVGQFFYGMHKASVVMVAGVAANIVNLVLSAALVFGEHAPASMGWFGTMTGAIAKVLGTPAMGVKGSAIGTVIATGVELAIPLAMFLGKKMNDELGTRSAWRLSWPHVRDLLKIGWPSGLMFGNEMICWGFFMVYLVSHYGKEHATAGWIAHQYMSLSFMPAVGISVACTAIVGKYMGMGKPEIAQARAWLGVRFACVYMGLCGIGFVVFRHHLVKFFVPADTPTESIDRLVELGSAMLIATAAFQLFDAVAMVLSGALRGAGDTVFPGVMTVAAAWIVIVGGGFAMQHYFPQLQSVGAWIAAAAYIFTLSTILLVRFLAGHWKKIELLQGEGKRRPNA